MQEYWDILRDWATLYGLKVIGAIAIFVIGRIIIGMLISGLRRLMQRTETDETLTRFLLSLTKITLLIFVIIAALGTLGVETASFIAIIGAAGLAVGFALQGSLANFASGIMLIVFRPFKAGDFVEAGGNSGLVEEIHIFNTVMNTPDNKRVIIPNSQVTGGTIINYSAHDTRRVDLVFGIGYGDDIRRAKEILNRLLKEDPRVLADPAPQVVVGELADSSVNFNVRPWARTEDYWNLYFDLTEKVKLAFDAEGVSIPFPQRDVHLYRESNDN
jgi:small conductance mechanosensitive channel